MKKYSYLNFIFVLMVFLSNNIFFSYAMETGNQKFETSSPLMEEISYQFLLDLQKENGISFTDIDVLNIVGSIVNRNDLDLYGRNIKKIPESIGELSSIKKLNLAGNELTILPGSIKNLKDLEEINLGSNHFKSLSSEFFELVNLKSLSLNNNQLSNLPLEIGKLIHLETLAVSHNQLTTLPAEIGHLGELKNFYLRDNKLVHLPPEIGELAKLTYLDASNNQLKELPPQIGKLVNITDILVNDNLLESLPNEIGNMRARHLHFNRNKLGRLPQELSQLRFTQLKIEGNPVLESFKNKVGTYQRSDLDEYFGIKGVPQGTDQNLLSKVDVLAETFLVPFKTEQQIIPGIPNDLQGIPTTVISVPEEITHGIIVFLHGGPELSVHDYENGKFVLQDKFKELASQFVAAKFKVVMIDIRGSKINKFPYQKAYVDAYSLYDQQFMNDIESSVQYIKKQNPNLPIYGMMHSFGGYHGMITIVKKPHLFDKVVLLAPSIGYALEAVTLLYKDLNLLKEQNIMVPDWKVKLEMEGKRYMGPGWEPRLDPLFSKEVYDNIEPINTFCAESLKSTPIFWIHNQNDNQVSLPMAADFLAKCFDYFDKIEIQVGNRGGHSFFYPGFDPQIYLFYVKQISRFLRSDSRDLGKLIRIVDFNTNKSLPSFKVTTNSSDLKTFRNNPIFKFKQDEVEPFNVNDAFGMIEYIHGHQGHDNISRHMEKQLLEESQYKADYGDDWPKTEAEYQKWIEDMISLS